jgi:hypothetical protein
VRIAASHLGSEKYERGHLFMGPVVGPAQMSRDCAADLWKQSGMGPDDINLVQVHDAFVIEELEYYELLGFCREGRRREAHRRGHVRARRQDAVLDRRRAHRARPSRRPDGPRADLGDGAPAPRHRRQAAGAERARRASAT